MALFRLFNLWTFFLVVLAIQPLSRAFSFKSTLSSPYPKAISDLKEAIVKGLGLASDDFKISGFDFRDALVGHSVAYEFDIEIDNKVVPVKLLEDVKRWEYVDLPIFQMEDSIKSSENGLIQRRKLDDGLPVLAPFQLAGPMELWIHDAKDMRLSLPHDVDAGVLKKMILADGAVITVKGARSVSLRQPVDLPLPLNRSHDGFASGLFALADHIRHSSRTQGAPTLSLCIVGPTSLTSPSSPSPLSKNKLKLKLLAPGLVELSSRSKTKAIEAISAIDLQGEAPTLLTPDRFATLWPFSSINVSNSNLLGFETLLFSLLGPKTSEKGSFKLLKADVSAHTYMKIGFGVEKKLGDGDGFYQEGIPAWRTKPEVVRMHFEVLAKVEGDRIVPETVKQIPVAVEDTVAHSVLSGNVTMSTTPIFHPPSKPFTL